MDSRKKRFVVRLLFASFLCGCNSAPDEIIRISRQSNSGTFAYFREAVVGTKRELKLGSLDLSGSKDVVEMVASTPNAIGFSGMGYANDRVKMLRLKSGDAVAVAPTADGVSRGDYPLARKLYIYVVGEPRGAVHHFLQWILSPTGQGLVEQVGYVPLTTQSPHGSLDQPPAASIKIAGSDTMVNLAQAWAEEYSAAFPSVRPEVAGGGTGVGIAKLIDGTIQMANASREMKSEEKKQIETKFSTSVQEYVVALDALAVFVHASNPIEELSMEQLGEIFGEGGQLIYWAQLQTEEERREQEQTRDLTGLRHPTRNPFLKAPFQGHSIAETRPARIRFGRLPLSRPIHATQ